ncbi:helix-turn-helix domain-containing protein [Microbispora triticiradicis]|uniref:Helix-turn-helix domain-containing protein n=2 Tax=Microbispora TaxID=2005 RepID=A0ABY3LP15_9ACTN|nr:MULTISPECIES: helix-turn-helix transcriptional regulator [Microbispora]TLP66549.1 helix-turn-helix domain-containing protein [Microbispora fusca]TYB43207.1 helix-turn-helix domain-containing protein [Microbispora tritici]
MEERRDRLRELGELLRRLRKGVGLTGKELAERAGVAQPTISRMETGQLLPTPETVERVAAALQLDQDARRELDTLLARLRDEVSRLRGGLAGREAANAARVRSSKWIAVFSSAMIPALLQTAEYARLAVAIGRDVDEDDAAKAAAIRVDAQAVLFEEGRRFAFVLTEGAVRTWPGSPSLMLAQLDRLAQVSTLPHVRLGVVPWKVEAPAFPLHGFTVFDGSVSVVESLTGDLTLTEAGELSAHEEAFGAFADGAVYGDDLRALLGEIGADFRKLAKQLGD